MRYLKKTCAVTLSAAMVLSLAATAGNVSYAASNVEKEETVYVNQDATGNVSEVTVSNWLKNVTGTKNVEDVSNLNDIKNVKGDEEFTQGSNGTLIWKAENKDIYYQGTTDEKPPIGVKISYQMDGKEVDVKDMAGKSGKLKMTIQYENNATFQDEVDGKKVEMNTPFLMASAVILPVDTFSGVTVDQGKLVSEGSNQILVAYGMPGLADSLNLSDDMRKEMDDKLGDTVTIEATVKDFNMGSIYTVASSSEFSDIDLGDNSDINDLENAVNDLAEATDELISGSSDLSDGLTTLQNNFKTYASGVNDLKKGASNLSDGAGKLSKGVTQYTNGVTTLTTGASQYVTGTNQLTTGVSQYIEGEKKVDDGVSQLYNGVKDFPTQYDEFHNGLSTYVNAVNGLPATLNSKVSEQVGTIVNGYNDTMAGVTTDTAIAAAKQAVNVDAQVDALAQQLGLPDDVKPALKVAMNEAINKAIAGGATAQKQVDMAYVKGVGEQVASKKIDFTESFAPLVTSGNTLVASSADKIKPGIASVTGGVKDLYDGVKQLSAANESLLAGATALSASGVSLTEGIKTLSSNSKTLTSSAKQLSKGASKLSKGANKLNGATKEVSDGVKQLQDGSVTLLDGMNQFKDEGTGKLQSEYNNQIKTVMDRFKAITKDADDYNTFSGIADDMDGSVKFIFQTEEIKGK